MNTSKKMTTVFILEILKKYSDAEHRLTQKKIQNLLKMDYELEIDRKSVKRNLMDLLESGYPIEYDSVMRTNKDGEAEEIDTGFYMEGDFSDAEIRLLLDSILFSRHIPEKQKQNLAGKLEKLSSMYFRTSIKNIKYSECAAPINQQLFYTIDVLDEAINMNKKICFYYNYYDIDKKLHARIDPGGAPHQYIVNPLRIAAANGKYYLIGNYDKYDNISHYRLDRISEMHVLDDLAKDKSKINGISNNLNLSRHMAEHIYMFSGESSRITFSAPRHLVTEIIDWFGMDVIFTDVTKEGMTAGVVCNEEAFRYWALQYGRFVTVQRPLKLKELIKSDIADMAKRYDAGDGSEENECK
jgi:predicted DNA-binding transcriptional regulator YafY